MHKHMDDAVTAFRNMEFQRQWGIFKDFPLGEEKALTVYGTSYIQLMQDCDLDVVAETRARMKRRHGPIFEAIDDAYTDMIVCGIKS